MNTKAGREDGFRTTDAIARRREVARQLPHSAPAVTRSGLPRACVRRLCVFGLHKTCLTTYGAIRRYLHGRSSLQNSCFEDPDGGRIGPFAASQAFHEPDGAIVFREDGSLPMRLGVVRQVGDVLHLFPKGELRVVAVEDISAAREGHPEGSERLAEP